MGNGRGPEDAEPSDEPERRTGRADGGFAEHDLEEAGDRDRSAGDGSVARSLLAEIEDGSVPAEVVDQLGRELRADRSRVLDVRVRQLTQDVEELRAYTAALEEFIDEHGTAEQVLSSVRSEARELTATVEQLGAEVERLDTTVAARGDRLERIVNALEVLGEDVGELSARTDELSAAVEDVAARTGDQSELRADVSTLSDALRSESEAREALASEVDALRSRVEDPDDLAGRVDDLEARVDAVSDEVAALSEETTAVRSELEDLGDWVARIRAIFDSLAADVEGRPTATPDDATRSAGQEAGSDQATVAEPTASSRGETSRAARDEDDEATEESDADSSFSIDLDVEPDAGDDRPSPQSETDERSTRDDPEDSADGGSDTGGSVADRVGEFVVDLDPPAGVAEGESGDVDVGEPAADAEGESAADAREESADADGESEGDPEEDDGFDGPAEPTPGRLE